MNNLLRSPWLVINEQEFIQSLKPDSCLSTPCLLYSWELCPGLGGAIFGRGKLQILSTHMSAIIHGKTMGKSDWRSCILNFQELRNAQSEQLMGIRREEEMEMSDDDENCDSPTKKMRVDESGNTDHCHIPVRYCTDLSNPRCGIYIGQWPHNSYLFELY